MSGTLECKRAATQVVKSLGLQADLTTRAVVLAAADSPLGNSLRDLIQLNEDDPALKALVEELLRGEGTDIPKKRRLPSSYAHRRKKLPSASGMNLTIMRQQQGVMTYNEITQQPCFLAVDPLYMNYRCNVYQAAHGLVLIAEFKIGLDDKAQPEALRYHEQLWEETWPDILNQSFAATFVIEMMGAGLRIGGAAWGEKICYEALTPVMNLVPLWGQESAMLRLAQQVTALLACLAELYAEYSIPAPTAQSERAGLYGDGIPIALHDMHRFQNVSCYDADHALYSYRDPGSGQKRLAKFTGRYGTAVHAAWASAGLAPALFDVTELQPHSLLVTMELLPESWRMLSVLSDPELLELRPYVLQALQLAHCVEITIGTTGAHGDVRLPNVAVRLEGQQWHVRFLDFDWAGVAGELTYPPFMNPEIEWPSGAHAYAVMLSEHDVALLQLQFDLALH